MYTQKPVKFFQEVKFLLTKWETNMVGRWVSQQSAKGLCPGVGLANPHPLWFLLWSMMDFLLLHLCKVWCTVCHETWEAKTSRNGYQYFVQLRRCAPLFLSRNAPLTSMQTSVITLYCNQDMKRHQMTALYQYFYFFWVLYQVTKSCYKGLLRS